MNKEHFIVLLPHEALNMYDSAVTTATVFSGEAPVEFLALRVQEILDENPWLTARLCTNDRNEVCLRIPAEVTVYPFYEQVNITDVCAGGDGGTRTMIRQASEPPLSDPLAALFTKQGFKCLDKDEPLFKVRLCIGNDGMCILLVSMSHVFGDGSTLYNIYRMLAPDSPVVAMTPERLTGFQQHLVKSDCIPGSCWLPRTLKANGNEKLDWLLKSKAMRSTAMSRAFSGLSEAQLGEDGMPRPSTFGGGLFRVDSKWIEQKKAQFEPESNVPWLSANDVISSWYFNTSGASAGVMTVDVRQHINGLTPAHAGNYQVGLLYYPNEYKTPSSIRRAITRFPSYPESDGKAGTGETVALISNWAKFYTELDYGEACHLIMHFPLVPPELSTPTLVNSIMIVFRPRVGELAVALGADNVERFFDGTVLGVPLFPGN